MICVCAHSEGAHRHYREGTECAMCGCAGFQRSRVPEPVPNRQQRRAQARADLQSASKEK